MKQTQKPRLYQSSTVMEDFPSITYRSELNAESERLTEETGIEGRRSDEIAVSDGGLRQDPDEMFTSLTKLRGLVQYSIALQAARKTSHYIHRVHEKTVPLYTLP